MNGIGCRNCPVEKCETLNYRGSVCAAQRAKLGLGDPNDRTECWQFKDCSYRNDVGWCPENCHMYLHKDYVGVVRCKDCRYSSKTGRPGYLLCNTIVGLGRGVVDDDFCSHGERRTYG
jgi:hypothetical protein